MNFNNLFKLAKEKGIEDLQVYFSESTNFEIEVFKGELDKYQISDSASLKVKGIYDGKMGTVSTEKINEKEFEFLINSVIASAKEITSEDEVFIYEGDKKYKEVTGLFNNSIEEISAKQKIADTEKLEKIALDLDDRVKFVQAFFGQGKTNVRIENSKGLKLEKLVNSGILGVYVITNNGEDQRTAFEYVQSNDYADFDLNDIAKKAVDKGVSLLGAKSIPSGQYEILLKNLASASLFAPHVTMFSAESVQKDVSLLKGKLNEKIGSEHITLVDDPFKKKSSKSGSFDDEGVATRYKKMVDKGELKTFLHNLKTAKKANTKSTGNGALDGIKPSNFYFKSGSLEFDDAVKSMTKGLIITDLAGTHAGCNPVSGDFSLQASGFLVEDGKIIKPVSLITIAGNYLDLLKNVTGVCNDLRFNFGFIGSPSLKIKSLQVSGD
ncbi:MAG: TldD/PmbA family protein [Candidatus Izimaplasma sp.]|nr:TldD/PmbA family protein [Candidatus Izimaplasma bacterium]